MKRLWILILIFVCGALILLPVLRNNQKAHHAIVDTPDEQIPINKADQQTEIQSDVATPRASETLSVETSGSVRPMPDGLNTRRKMYLIVPALLGTAIVAFTIVRVARRKQPRFDALSNINMQSTYEYQEESNPDYSAEVKSIIAKNRLRPLGNKKRLALYGNDNFNVRLLLFSGKNEASKYFRLITAYAQQEPPPDFVEICLIYIPDTIFAEKHGIIIPNEYNDSEGIYRDWLRGCFLSCNGTMRMQVSTDHKYGELHRRKVVVFEWTVLVTAEFTGSAEEYPEIWKDDESNSFPPIKLIGDKDAVIPPEKPQPQGNWIGVVFNIASFDEALYGKASIDVLLQAVGKEILAGTIIHGGDLDDGIHWCLAIHTASDEQYDKIKNAVNGSDDPHFDSIGKRVISIYASHSLPYKGFVSVKGELV